MELTPEEFKTKLGKRIKQLRVYRGLEQGELAAIIGRDKQFINRYERQGANPTVLILVQLAMALKVSIDELLDFTKL